MRRASVATAVAGLALSLLVSVAAWLLFDSLLLFLFVPFVPFLFRRLDAGSGPRRPPVRRCPRCGFRTVDRDFEYCPRDGTRLERDADDRRP